MITSLKRPFCLEKLRLNVAPIRLKKIVKGDLSAVLCLRIYLSTLAHVFLLIYSHFFLLLLTLLLVALSVGCVGFHCGLPIPIMTDAKEQMELAFRKVLGDKFGKSPESRGLRKGEQVKLYNASDSEVVEIGTATLCGTDSDSGFLQRQLHLHQLPQTSRADLIVITRCTIKTECSHLPYPYSFKGVEEPPKTLGAMLTAGLYVWDTRMMELAVSQAEVMEVSLSRDGSRGKVRKSSASEHSVPNKRRKLAKGATRASDVVLSDDDGFVEDGQEIAIRHFDQLSYRTFEARVRISQILPAPLLLRDLNSSHVRGLEQRFMKFGYDYSSGLMTVTIRKNENKDLVHSTHESTTDIQDGSDFKSRYLKPSLRAVIVDGHHRYQSLLNIRDKQVDKFKWLSEPLRVTIVIRSDGAPISNTEILQLGSQRNHVSSTVRPFETLEDHIYAVMSFCSSFAEEGGISTKEVRPSNLAAQMKSSDLIPNLKVETYRRYARIAKLFTTHPNAFKTLRTFNPEEHPRIGAVHLDHSFLHEVDEQGLNLFLEAIVAYVRSPGSSGPFRPSPFFANLKYLYERCRHAYNEYGVPKQLSFQQFLSTEIPFTTTKTMTIKDTFISQIRLFSNKSKVHQEKNWKRGDRFATRLRFFFEPKAAHNEASKQLLNKEKNARKKVPSSSGLDSQAVDPEESYDDREQSRRRSARSRRPIVPSQPSYSEQGSHGNSSRARLSSKTFNRKNKKTRKESRRMPSDSVSLAQHENNQTYPKRKENVPPFDDLMAPLIPHGYNDLEPYQGDLDPPWQAFVSLPPATTESILEILQSSGVLHQTPWLRGLHIPLTHRAHLYADVASLLYLQRLAWLLACKVVIDDFKTIARAQKDFIPECWESALCHYKNGLGGKLFSKCESELKHRGYCVLEGFADDSGIPESVRTALKRPKQFENSASQLFSHYLNSFPGEDALKDSEKSSFWNPIINTGKQGIDRNGIASGRARYSTTRMFLVDVTEESGSTVWASVRRAFLDVWIGQLASLIGVRNNEQKIWTPKTGGRFLITGKNCPRQMPHIDFQVNDRNSRHISPGFFAIVSTDHGFPLWVCDYSHNFVMGPASEVEKLGSSLRLRKIVVPPHSVFFGHGNLTHAGAGYESRVSDNRSIRYHLYLIPEGKSLPDGVFTVFPDLPFEDENVLIEIERELEVGSSTSKIKAPQVSDQDNSDHNSDSEDDYVLGDEHNDDMDDDVLDVRSDGSDYSQ